MIKDCMKKVVAVNLHQVTTEIMSPPSPPPNTCGHQVIRHDDDVEIKAYYAGHVLGAAIFSIRVGDQSIVYTGDYNMTPDRHLGAAWSGRSGDRLPTIR